MIFYVDRKIRERATELLPHLFPVPGEDNKVYVTGIVSDYFTYSVEDSLIRKEDISIIKLSFEGHEILSGALI